MTMFPAAFLDQSHAFVFGFFGYSLDSFDKNPMESGKGDIALKRQEKMVK